MAGKTVSAPPSRVNSYDSYTEISAWDEGYTNSLFELDYEKNPSKVLEIKKIQYAFYIWQIDSKDTDNQIEGFKIDVKDGWTELYQLIGFFSVFQGVLFQGLAQLTSQLSCSFYKIPFALSVLASIATIVGAHFKLSKVRKVWRAFFRAKLRSKVLGTRIKECRDLAKEGLSSNSSLDFKSIEEKANQAVDELRHIYEGQLVKNHRERLIILVLLTTFSGLFAWIIRVIMCHEYF